MNPPTIEDILKKYQLGSRLISKNVPTNPWFALFEQSLANLCAHLTERDVRFVFTDSFKIQACAIYDLNYIVVTAQMFDMLCRIAAKITQDGIFTNLASINKSQWNPDIKNHLDPILKSLFQEPFNWNPAAFEWQRIPERQYLFFYILQTLSRFVVLHEVGHFVNGHNRRTGNANIQRIDIDMAEPEIEEHGIEKIQAQAKEVIADSYAFAILLDLQQHDINTSSDDNTLMRIINEKLFEDEIGKISTPLCLIYI